MDCIRPSIDALDIFNTGELGVHLRANHLTTVSAYSTREKAQFQAIVDHLTDFKYLLGLSKRSDIPTIDATARELAGLWTKSSLLTGEVYWLSPEVHVVIMRVVGVELTKLAKLFIDLSFIETDSFVEREKNVNKHEKFERVGNWVGTQLLEALESRLKVDKLAKSDKPQLQGLFLLVYLTLYGLTYKLGSNVSPVYAACFVVDDILIVCVCWYYTERLFCIKESGTATVTAPLPCQDWDLDIPILFQRRAKSA
jgi:hypothetical protein